MRERPEPPYVVVAGDRSSPLLRAALAGLEEEGVPGRVVTLPSPAALLDELSDALAAARWAAARSPLEVGLAITADAACLTHAKFAAGHAIEHLRSPRPGDVRRLGHNAARVVCCVPLR